MYGQTMVSNIAYGKQNDRAQQTRYALYLYNRMYWQARLKAIFHRIDPLDNLHQLDNTARLNPRIQQGIQTVAIKHITGSEGRMADFNKGFEPLNEATKDRWVSIAEARQQGASLPAVDLIKVGSRYYVRDGHHRISVARAMGELFVDARVTEWA